MNPRLRQILFKAALPGLVLLSFACAKAKPAEPDFVVFASGSLYGQLHTCG